MSRFAWSLTSIVNSWVENQTRLDGNYDIRFNWPLSGEVKATAEGLPPDSTFIFGVLQNQLGLKLQPVKGPVPVFVIQRAELAAEN